MTRISGYTYSGTPNDQLRYVSTKVVSSGATALITSLEDVNVTLSAGEINVSAFRNTSDVPTDAYLYANGESLAAVSELWEGFGGFDATANVFRAFPIVLDGSAMPATPAVIPLAGEYRAAPTTYTDGNATVLQTDANGALRVTFDSVMDAPQALGTDAAGADVYATILTTSTIRNHITASLEGANAAIISLDGGTTDHIYLPANSMLVMDNLLIASGIAVQAKNASAGNNYANLAVTVW